MDIVYPLASGNHGRKKLGSKWDNNELRYSLRSLQQYFPSLGRVFIVTEILPSWITNVVHLYAKDTHEHNKDGNLIDKVLLACRAGVSETFIRLSDDQCLLREWDGRGVWHVGNQFDLQGEIRKNKWWRRFAKTCEHLESCGRPTYFYDCHCPIPVQREEFMRAVEIADYATPPGMCINTLYCNSVDLPREQMNGQKIAVHKQMGLKKMVRATEGKLFLGYTDACCNKVLKKFLQERFQTPSRFER